MIDTPHLTVPITIQQSHLYNGSIICEQGKTKKSTIHFAWKMFVCVRTVRDRKEPGGGIFCMEGTGERTQRKFHSLCNQWWNQYVDAGRKIPKSEVRIDQDPSKSLRQHMKCSTKLPLGWKFLDNVIVLGKKSTLGSTL